MQRKNELTATEKNTRGLPLSGADIVELLKDPNSWVAKLYRERELEAAIRREEFREAFIAFIVATMREVELADYENKAAQMADQRALARQQLIAKLEAPSKQALSTTKPPALILLNIEENALLFLSQEEMSDTQLAVHHQQLMNHISNQIRAHIGPKLVVKINDQDVELYMPKEPLKHTSATAAQIIAQHPNLQEQLITGKPKEQQAVLMSLQNQETLDHLLHEVKAILQYNFDLDPQSVKPFNMTHRENFNLPPSLVKHLDQIRLAYAKQNASFIEHLRENGLRGLENKLAINLVGNQLTHAIKIPSATAAQLKIEGDTVKVSQPPAMYAHRTSASQPTLENVNKAEVQNKKKAPK